ncbi:thioredoxin domain-containing protein [Planosporangium thailandense]|uniref:Thioredoxin domain-containing protein n=1 Tax=Planosporangium thailandense TaxID=765197 RepID=A0ABX0Y8F9_9ACTN|nr:thioredoxin domain-containing protein [Planosporangium thailandense]NJC73715.1 thioredoxin domain-containing protein [Planosporangium thailandense]
MSSRVNKKEAARVVREQIARERARARRMWVSIGVVAVLVIAGFIGFGVYQSQRSSSYATPPHATANADGLVVGSGPKTVEVYLDFMCPVCNRFEQESGTGLNQMVSDKKIKLVYHPLAFLDRNSTTNYSTRSANAFACAASSDKLQPYLQALYANQPQEGGAGLPDDKLIQLGHSAGVSDSAFDKCVRDGTYKSWVQHVTDKAVNRGVTGTPTVYVDGKQIENPTLTNIQQAVGA